MKRIFIDCGGYYCTSIERFMRTADYTPDTEMYSFEPNPDCHGAYEGKDYVKLMKYACWTNNAMTVFNRKTRFGGQANSIIDNGTFNPDRKVIVQCIDFPRWFSENTAEGDDIVLKMDIEGAEYRVIPEMLNRGLFKRIRKAYMEWHDPRRYGRWCRRKIQWQNPNMILLDSLEYEIGKR